MGNQFIDPDAPFGLEHGPGVTGVFAPIFDEEVHEGLPVEGKIPADLNGVYLRNGPNPRFKPNGDYHPFDGDGMLHAAHFKDGKVVIRNKWVRTLDWEKEDKTSQSEFWGIRKTLKGRPDKPLKDSANTDVIGHGGYAVACWYMAGIPYLINPITLETIKAAENYVSGNGKGFSAHPKVDEITGELMYFDYYHEHPYMSYGVVSPEGELVHHVPIELPGSRLPHDMAITEHYSILHDLPVLHKENAYEAGRHAIQFDSSLPARFGVIPRTGESDSIRWFEFSPCFLYHAINAWEEGEEIIMIACRFMPQLNEDGSIDEKRTAHLIGHLGMDSRLWRYTMNMKTGETKEECLDPDHNIEFPTYNSALTGRRTQWAYLVDHNPSSLHWTGINKYNTDTGERVGEWTDGHDCSWYSEPWFAPADNPKSEDHGYVISFVWNDKSKQQELQVFDALDISKGPVARVKMPHRIPSGFHGCWMKPEQIASA